MDTDATTPERRWAWQTAPVTDGSVSHDAVGTATDGAPGTGEVGAPTSVGSEDAAVTGEVVGGDAVEAVDGSAGTGPAGNGPADTDGGVEVDADLDADPDPLDDIDRLLGSVEASLRRLDDGTYGICAACGEQIDDAPLAADPTRDRCDGCVGGVVAAVDPVG